MRDYVKWGECEAERKERLCEVKRQRRQVAQRWEWHC